MLYLDGICVVRTGRLVVRFADELKRLGARVLYVDASSERRTRFKASLQSAGSLLEILTEWCASASMEVKMGAPIPRGTLDVANKILRGYRCWVKRRGREILFHVSMDTYSIYGVIKTGKILAKYCRKTLNPIDPGAIPPWLCVFQLQEIAEDDLKSAGRRLMNFYEYLIKSARRDVILSSDPERDDE